jgi:Flp pilus assembly protein TadD
VSKTLLLTIAALTLAVTSHAPLGAQQGKYVTEVSNRSDASMAMLPMATSSAAARMHIALGQRALDMGRQAEAQQHFSAAVAADSTSAFARYGAASSAASLSEYGAGLDAAAKLASGASRAEQLQITIAQKAWVDDYAGAETAARELVTVAPRNPRAYLALANVQQQAGNEAEARVSMKKAIAIAPRFAPSYRALAYSYMTAQPSDPSKAKQYVDRLVALEPKESQSFITQGSFYRATNQLPLARTAYTRAAQLAPDEALPLQQRGHVESFLGNYDAARADYDAAIKLGKGNEAGQFRLFRALVSAYAGDPRRSIAELDSVAANADAMNLPDPVGTKYAALTAEAQIAIQSGDFESAARAIAQRTPVARERLAQASDENVRRLGEADIAYFDGLLAARKGDAAMATAKADEIVKIVAPTANPQKDQPAHAVRGVLLLEQKDYAGAAAELAQANQNDMFVVYERALALDGAGKTAEAKALFRKIARYNFSGPAQAVARADAAKRSM